MQKGEFYTSTVIKKMIDDNEIFYNGLINNIDRNNIINNDFIEVLLFIR